MRTYKEQIPEILGPVMTGQCIMGPGGGDGQWFTGIKSEVFYNDADVNVEANLLSAEYLGVIGGGAAWDVYNFEARALGQSVKFSEYGMPDIDYTDPLCKDENDLDKIKWPTANPLDAGRYPLAIQANELAEKYTGMPTQFFGATVSHFSLAVELFSFAGLMKIIKKQPDLAHEIMRKLVDDIQVPLVKAVAAKYPGAVYKNADAWEMLPNISPRIEREFVWPYYDRLREAIKEDDVTVLGHNTYGEAAMPDPAAYLKEKVKYSGGVSFTDTEHGVPREIYSQVANECGVPLTLIILSKLHDLPPNELIEYIRGLARDFRIPTEQFSWVGYAPYGTSLENCITGIAAGKAFSINPCPTLEELEKIEVVIPEMTQSFGDFVRAKAAENPDGYTFKWLDQARFIGE